MENELSCFQSKIHMLNFKSETDKKMMEDTKEIFEDLSQDMEHLKRQSDGLDRCLGMSKNKSS